jgi:ketosteroid isomerase-like protein
MSRQPSLRAFAGVAMVAAGTCMADDGTLEADRNAVALLDIRYQFAVERNDAEAIALIHHDNMILVLSNGSVVTGKQIEQLAREKARAFERQVVVDDSRVVRVWGDTAVVTAKLWLKGTRSNGDAFDHKLWYSDTYVRTPAGWRYFFGQAGAPLPQ